MANKNVVAKRIRLFGEKKYRTMAELARQLKMKPQALQSYLDAKSFPGGQILAKLRDLGCDINWLLAEDSDLEYVSLDEIETVEIIPQIEYKIAGVVPAGHAEIFDYNDWYENEPIDYNPDTHVFLKIDEQNGTSMIPLLQPSDLVLIDLNSKPRDGDIVAARWDETGGAVKILNMVESEPDKIALLSFNQAIKPIIKEKKNVVLYKVVMIKKVGKKNGGY